MDYINIRSEKYSNPGNKRNILTPSRVLALGFAIIILIGAFLLSLPISSAGGQGLSFLNALFTSTSAVCVTGLVVVDTGTYFSAFGQIVILLLIQIGGLGFMTFASLFALLLGKKINLKERILLKEAYNQMSIEGIVRLTKYIVIVSFLIEGIGAIILTIRWSFDMGLTKALYFGVFHSISAFNNAGFDLFGTSLVSYKGDLIINLTIILLIIVGGLGFAVLSDIYYHKDRKKFSLNTKVVIWTTGILILIGSIIIFILEYSNPLTLGNLDPGSKILTSIFQGVTPRTAGFNTLNIHDLTNTSLLFIIALMFIGASPGSTGGGIKTTTFVTIFLSVISTFRNNCPITIGERTIPRDLVQRAIAIFALALSWILLGTAVLTITENTDFLTLLFETFSAFNTVGLSMGITSHLSTIGKIVIILSMFAGRVGLLTIAFALGQKSKEALSIKYPEEKILIG